MREKEGQANPGARYMSPLVKQDLAKLDKDGESRRSAMNSLKHFVENLDPGSMPRFLAQVSETRDQGASRSYAISLYEDVARVHGKLIIPHIPRVMATIRRSLSSSGSSPQLHQACAKVVAALAKHSVDPCSLAQADKILRDLCNPLLDVLSGKLEPLAAGAAVCLQALVECEKWQYASDEVVNEACLRITVALGEKITRTVAHLQLARSLATTNPFFFNSYGVALLRTCSEVLRQTSASGTWQQKASAARLLQAVLPTVDRATLTSELGDTAQALDDCKHDRMAHVRTAVSDALKTVKVLSSAARLSCDEESPAVIWKRIGETHSSLGDSVITVYRKQEGVDLLTDEEVSSSCTTVDIEVGSDTDSYQCSPPSKQSSHNQARACTDCIDLVSTSRSRSSKCPMVMNQPTRESVEGRAVQSMDESVASHILDDSCCNSSGTFLDSDYKGCLNDFSDRQLTINSVRDLGDQEDLFVPQKPECLITAEDFLPFNTPRRLVRSLQSSVSCLSGGGSVNALDVEVEDGVGDMLDMDLETRSDAGWSVRDNPIASDVLFKINSEEEDKQPQGSFCKETKIDSSVSDCSESLKTGNLCTSKCQKNSFAFLQVAESLFCTGTGRALEPEFCNEDEVVETTLDHKVDDLGIAPAHSCGGLRSLVGENGLSECIYRGKAFNKKQLCEDGGYLVGEAEVESDANLTCSNESIVGVLCIGFCHSLRDIFSKNWGSVHAYGELLLGGLLLVVLALPFAMVMSKFLWSHFDHPGLIPT